MSLTSLERAILEAISSLRGSTFGSDVLLHAPGRRVDHLSQLAQLEFSLDPPVRRTFAALNAAKQTGMDLLLDAPDHHHVEWVDAVLEALRAIADRFWGDVRPDTRLLFVDVDDVLVLPFQPSYALPMLRVAHPPTLRTAMRRAGLSDRDLQALHNVWQATQTTPAYGAAVEAQARVRADRNLLLGLRAHRERVVSAPPPPRNERLPEYAQRVYAQADDAYLDRPPAEATAASALRRYNRLIHAVLDALLGGVEGYGDVPRLDPGDEAIDAVVRQNQMSINLTVRRASDFVWLRILSPFVIDVESPVDGLYLTTGYSFRSLGAFMMLDASGDRLRDLGDPRRLSSPVRHPGVRITESAPPAWPAG